MIGEHLVDFAQRLGVAEDIYRVLALDESTIQGVVLARLNHDIGFDGHLFARQVCELDVDVLG